MKTKLANTRKITVHLRAAVWGYIQSLQDRKPDANLTDLVNDAIEQQAHYDDLSLFDLKVLAAAAKERLLLSSDKPEHEQIIWTRIERKLRDKIRGKTDA